MRRKMSSPSKNIFLEAKKCMWCKEFYVGSAFWEHLRECRRQFFAAFGHKVKE